jgi:membrane-associated HD superfamily phosphohydrolase
MNKDAGESRHARQTANRRSHPIWRGIFIYSITCNLTIILTLVFTRRDLNSDSYPILSTMVVVVYLFSEIFLLLVSPFFIRRFGDLATLGLIVALINFPLILSLCGRS